MYLICFLKAFETCGAGEDRQVLSNVTKLPPNAQIINKKKAQHLQKFDEIDIKKENSCIIHQNLATEFINVHYKKKIIRH